jgi:hypothetical protein
MAPDQIVEGQEISQMQDGHVVDNGEKVQPEEVTPQMMWKKLEAIQQDQQEIKERLRKVENNTEKPGGGQPRKHFSRDALIEEKAGQQVLSELGKDLKDKVDKKGSLDKNEFKELMIDHDWIASSETTYRNWMEKVAAHFDSFGFEVGKSGGSNEPSRIVWEGY